MKPEVPAPVRPLCVLCGDELFADAHPANFWACMECDRIYDWPVNQI